MNYPPATGKVIVDTSHGELEVELWCKEVPKGCRNFITLCLQGYYDNCKFHRLIPNFMIQGGDPTGTGEGGMSSYGGQPFQDEFHSRIQFATRGLLAYSNSGPNTNGSQFFITFDACPWQNNKYTIFGRVVGNTIYNLMSMNEIDTDSNDSPLYPIFIKSTQVIIDPFNITVKPLELPKEEQPQQVEAKQEAKKPAKKAKNISLLSFGDEEEEEQAVTGKVLNSHDVLEDARLKKEAAVSKEALEQKAKQREFEELKRNQLVKAVSKPQGAEGLEQVQKKVKIQREVELDLNEEDKELLNYKIVRNEKGAVEYVFDDEKKESEGSEAESLIEDEEMRKMRENQKEEYEKLRADILQFKVNKFGTNNPMIRDLMKHEQKLLSSVEARREKFLQTLKAEDKNQRLEDKIRKYQEKKNSEVIKQDKYHWLNHRLKFHIDSANAYNVTEARAKVEDYQARERVSGEQGGEAGEKRRNIELLMRLSE